MKNNFKYKFEKKNKKNKVIALVSILLILGFVVFAVNLGKADLSAAKVIKVFLFKITGNEGYIENIKISEIAIIWDIRMPRIITSLLVGIGLAVSGAVFQSLLMNPLADSYTMGVSTGAAFGASIAIYINIFIATEALPVTLFAFLGAFLTLLSVMRIAKFKGHLNSANMIIAGIIVSSILSAGISFIKSASGEQVAAIVQWLLGSMVAKEWSDVVIASSFIFPATLFCYYYSEELNIMSLGDKECQALGIDSDSLRKKLLIAGSLITAICVSVSGIIGFVGLIVPHILRFAVGSDNRVLIPLSAILGGGLLLVADTGARTLMNVEVPVGVITTLLGGPFFIYIFMKRNKSLYE